MTLEVAFVGEADASFHGDTSDVVPRISGQDLFPLEHARADGVESLLGDSEGWAVFQLDRRAGLSAKLVNGLAGLPCSVFGPLERDERLPAADFSDQVPERVTCGARRLERQPGCLGSGGKIDLAPFIGGGAEKTAYLCVPFAIEEGGTWTIGAGADWWMECYVDGEKALDTLATGNQCHPPSSDHRKDIVLAADGRPTPSSGRPNGWTCPGKRNNGVHSVVPTVRGDVRVDWCKGGSGFKIGVVLPDAMPTEGEPMNHNTKKIPRTSGRH